MHYMWYCQNVSISLMQVYFILRHILKLRKISATWIPHLFTHDKKWIQKRTAMQLLKMFFLFNQGQLQLLVIVTKHGFTINMSRMLFRTIKKLWKHNIASFMHGREPVVAQRWFFIAHKVLQIGISATLHLKSSRNIKKNDILF